MPHIPVSVNHMRTTQTGLRADFEKLHWLATLSCDPGELNIDPAPKLRLRLRLRCWCQRDPGKRTEGDVHRKHTLILVHRKVTNFFCSLTTLCLTPPTTLFLTQNSGCLRLSAAERTGFTCFSLSPF